MTAPVASCGTVMACQTEMGCWVPSIRTISSASRGWWPAALPTAAGHGQRVDAAGPPRPALPPFVVHVKPVGVHQPDYGARHIAALALIVEPGSQPRIDPGLVARTLGLTPMESRVAIWLAEGKSVRDIARETKLTEGAIYWHLKQIYQRLPGLPAGGPGAVGAVERRVRVTTPLLTSSLGGPDACPLLFFQKTTTFLQILPILVVA